MSLSISFILGGLATILLVIGIALTLPGICMNKYYCSGSLLSIPIYPKAANGLCEYVGVIPDGNFYYPISEPKDFDINFPLYLFNNLQKKQSIYLIHNLWGYNFNISASILTEGGSNKKFNYPVFTRNYGDDRSSDIQISDEFDKISRIIPSQFTFKKGCYFIYCPVSTLITKELDIEPECNTNYGAMASLRNIEYWQYLEIGDISFPSNPSQITFTFSNLTINPMDYISTPVVFLATWKMSSGPILKGVGIVIIDLALILYIISVIIFFFFTQRPDE